MTRKLENEDDDEFRVDENAATITFMVVATIIFFFVAYQFLFPVNVVIPLDRRTTAVLGSVLVYMSRTFLFNITDLDKNGNSFLISVRQKYKDISSSIKNSF